MNIIVSPIALQDLDESRDFYNTQKEGLGDEFAISVSMLFDRICENYLQFPIEYIAMRKAIIERFPFVVFFVVENDSAFILGIFHTSRNPRKMGKRFNSRNK